MWWLPLWNVVYIRCMLWSVVHFE